MPVEIGTSYEIITDVKSRSSETAIVKKGEHVTALKAGTQLYLVEAKPAEDGPRRCWVPAQWLKKISLTRSADSEPDVASLGERTLSEYSSSKSFPESDFSTERSRTSSELSTEGSVLSCKFHSH